MQRITKQIISRCAALIVLVSVLLGATLVDAEELRPQDKGGTVDSKEVDTRVVPADTAAADSIMAPSVQVDTEDAVIDTIKAVDQHPQDAPENRGFLIVTGDGKAQMRIVGSIRLTGFYDVNGLNDINFVTFDIPVGDNRRTEPRFFMTAQQTRMGFEMTRETGLGEAFLRIEADFASPARRFRLRHAYGELDHVLVGQTWTTFGDVSALPLTVDFEGPNSGVTVRNAQIRFYNERDDKVHYAIAIENPAVEVAEADTIPVDVVFQTTPDLTARYRRAGTYGQWQLAALARWLSYRDVNSNLKWVPGYGVSLTGKLRFWGSELLFQGIAGTAISRYVKALSGRGLDLVFNPDTQELESLQSWGYYVSLQHQWSAKWLSSITAGGAGVDNRTYQPETAYKFGQYVAITTFWQVSAGVRAGLEYNWGLRENKSGESGEANRFQYAVYYDF